MKQSRRKFREVGILTFVCTTIAKPAIKADKPLIAFNCSDFSVTARRASSHHTAGTDERDIDRDIEIDRSRYREKERDLESAQEGRKDLLSISLLSFSSSRNARSSSRHLYSQAMSAPWERVDKRSMAKPPEQQSQPWWVSRHINREMNKESRDRERGEERGEEKGEREERDDKDPIIFNSLNPHFSFQIFIEQMISHLIFPLGLPFFIWKYGWTFPLAHGFRPSSMMDFIGNWLFPIFFITTLSTAPSLPHRIGGGYIVPACIYLIHRFMVAIKYGSLSQSEYAYALPLCLCLSLPLSCLFTSLVALSHKQIPLSLMICP
jgi:hypothetical protein